MMRRIGVALGSKSALELTKMLDRWVNKTSTTAQMVDISKADIVVITAGAKQKTGKHRYLPNQVVVTVILSIF